MPRRGMSASWMAKIRAMRGKKHKSHHHKSHHKIRKSHHRKKHHKSKRVTNYL